MPRRTMHQIGRQLTQNLRTNWGVEGPFQWGTIASVSIGSGSTLSTVGVYLDNSSTGTGAVITAGLPFVSSYVPVVGDTVLITRMAGPARTQRVVVGPVSRVNGVVPSLANSSTGKWIGNWSTVGPPTFTGGILPAYIASTGDWGLDGNQNMWSYDGAAWQPVGWHLLQRLSGTTFPYDFLNIPTTAGYHNLQIKGRFRDNGTQNGFGNLQIRFNNDSTSQYDVTRYLAQGASMTVDQPISPASPGVLGQVGIVASNGLTNANIFVDDIIDIPGFDGGGEKDARGTGFGSTGTHLTDSDYQYNYITHYRQTTAISRITLSSDSTSVTAWNTNSWAELWAHR